MPVTHPKPGRSLFFAVLLLLRIGQLYAQTAQTQSDSSKTVSADSSSSLPDAPTPQAGTGSSSAAAVDPTDRSDVTFAGTPKRLLLDQKAIWTSPLHVRPSDAVWLLPLGTATGLLIGSDQHTMTSLININADDRHTFNTLSDAGVITLGALPASMYLWSLFNYAPQAHETGLLAGEAVADSLAVSEVGKFVSRRDRPLVNDAKGDFFNSSLTESSFPSNHATAAWALAAVIGDEYPGWITRAAVYGLATGVSASRVLSEQHFPSDVLIGSVTGWLIGHYVYQAHHNFSLNPFDSKPMPGDFGVPRQHKTQQASGTSQPVPVAHHPPRLFTEEDDPDTIGSTNVPMDSWVYPALERLAAMGFIPGQSVSIRPWTRQECLRQLRVAEDLADRQDYSSPRLLKQARLLIADLQAEFETGPTYYESASLESVYGRFGTIAGPALADSFHFGQTWWNDFGRPLGRGSSAILGYSVRANYGRLFFYDRQELQHGPGNPAESEATNQLINQLDQIQPFSDPHIEPIPERSAYTRQRPIELYGGMAFAGNEVSFGKQELYWGPTSIGPLAFSSNAEPTYNLRFVSTRPHPFPLVPSLGTYRFDIVLGKLSGHSYPARPWYNGQKIDLNFGDNLEMSFTRWSIFWGVGHPITFHTFKDNVFSYNSTGSGTSGGGGSAGYGDRQDPGDRKSNFDFSYRLPFLSRIVTLYADAYSDDDPSPIDAPRRAAWSPGIYFARLPFLPHMDLRVEAVSSTGLATDFGGQHFFINNQYLDGNTNKGFLLGNAVGRDGRAIEGTTNYWISARTKLGFGYRQNKGGTQFLPGGSTITDGFINGSYAINRHWQAQIFTQYERFLIPSYMNGSQHNTSGWLQVTWTPELHLHH
jgi:membrane-associated phospholipid phosphatase